NDSPNDLWTEPRKGYRRIFRVGGSRRPRKASRSGQRQEKRRYHFRPSPNHPIPDASDLHLSKLAVREVFSCSRETTPTIWLLYGSRNGISGRRNHSQCRE